jgi:lipoprotein-anchoring transpeptidase ErfK/SrfK
MTWRVDDSALRSIADWSGDLAGARTITPTTPLPVAYGPDDTVGAYELPVVDVIGEPASYVLLPEGHGWWVVTPGRTGAYAGGDGVPVAQSMAWVMGSVDEAALEVPTARIEVDLSEATLTVAAQAGEPALQMPVKLGAAGDTPVGITAISSVYMDASNGWSAEAGQPIALTSAYSTTRSTYAGGKANVALHPFTGTRATAGCVGIAPAHYAELLPHLRAGTIVEFVP